MLSLTNRHAPPRTIDYAIIENDLCDFIDDFEVCRFDSCMSDVHSPITISMRKNPIPNVLTEIV